MFKKSMCLKNQYTCILIIHLKKSVYMYINNTYYFSNMSYFLRNTHKEIPSILMKYKFILLLHINKDKQENKVLTEIKIPQFFKTRDSKLNYCNPNACS